MTYIIIIILLYYIIIIIYYYIHLFIFRDLLDINCYNLISETTVLVKK
jgi:hypothetical protein